MFLLSVSFHVRNDIVMCGVCEKAVAMCGPMCPRQRVKYEIYGHRICSMHRY